MTSRLEDAAARLKAGREAPSAHLEPDAEPPADLDVTDALAGLEGARVAVVRARDRLAEVRAALQVR